MARRYDQLIDIVRDVKPKIIVEIGVHKGLRAAMMCREALKYQENVAYFGFDVFDEEDQAFHDQALNGKGMPSEREAARRLNEIGPALTWQFIKGDTRKTLHGEIEIKSDLVFIDGDHRLEVIRGDYAPFAGAKCVVFDDFYRQAGTLDLDLYGCNRLVDELATEHMVEFLPVLDRCNHGAYAQLVAVHR